MRALSLHLTTESPLAIRADHAPTGSDMISYIPGTTLVGGLASIHHALNLDGEDFARFFLSGKVCFSDLYPANFEDLAGEVNAPVYPIPRTAISCKRNPGFRPGEPKVDSPHGAEDSLGNWALLALSDYKPDAVLITDLKKYKKCHICGESMDRLTGYYRRVTDSPSIREQTKSENKRLQTRTGINRLTGTVEAGILYNRMVFEENTEFWGQVTMPDDNDLYEAIYNFLEKKSAGLLRLGTGRTRGLGKIAMRVEDLYDETGEKQRFKEFKQRLIDLDNLIKEKARAFSLLPSQNEPFFFAVTLHSPLILCDELLHYQGKIDAIALNKALEKEIPDLELLHYNAGMKRVTGWNELWGTPKTNEYAIEAGSVFLFQCKNKLDEEQQKALFQLGEMGLGKRRTEGFGRICISDAFHSEKRQ
jgi:CRISPR-associated protein Csx10